LRKSKDKIYFNENEDQKVIRNSHIYYSSREDKVSNTSSLVTTLTNGTKSDSGLSSLNSAQLFFAEIREHLNNDKNKKNKKHKSYANISHRSKSVINTLGMDHHPKHSDNLIFNLGNVVSHQLYLNR
jgi:hypothetical protein